MSRLLPWIAFAALMLPTAAQAEPSYRSVVRAQSRMHYRGLERIIHKFSAAAGRKQAERMVASSRPRG
jgi:hypothetical protein